MGIFNAFNDIFYLVKFNNLLLHIRACILKASSVMSWVCFLFPSLCFSFLSLALALPVYFPHLFIVAISARAASLSHLFSLLSHYFLSTSSICFPLFFVWLFHVYVSHAIYMNIYLVLSCLIKSRGVVLVLCAFVSLSSCCLWPLTRNVFLPYEKLHRSLPLLKSLSSLCLFQFCVIARQTACLFFIKNYYKNLPLHLDPLFHLTE